MNTRKLRKAILTLCSALLLVSLSIGATLAYLTSTSEVVTNTFTAGNVTITLDEAKVDEYGVSDANAARVTGNEYKLIPGRTYTKDPTVHVAAGSEDCWLFVKVENGLGEDEDTIVTQMNTNGWTLVADETNVYAYKETVSAKENVVVFNTFTLDGDADVVNLTSAQIVITAYAVQADGFTTAGAAWLAAPAWKN